MQVKRLQERTPHPLRQEPWCAPSGCTGTSWSSSSAGWYWT